MKLYEEPLNSMVEELVNLLGAPDFYGLVAHDEPPPLYLVEDRLLEVFLNRRNLQTRQLAAYLRVTVRWARRCPTWHQLLNASLELARTRGEDVDFLFYGLQPLGSGQAL
jgi:hypothetical protein